MRLGSRTGLAAIVLVLGPLLASPAAAQQPADTGDAEQARAVFHAGEVAYARAQYERAIGYFEQAYALVPRVELLYNIGRCHEHLGHLAQAVTAYTRYGLDVPSARERQQVREHVAALEAEIARRRAAGEPENGVLSDSAAPAHELANDEPASQPPASPPPTERARMDGISPVTGWIVAGAGVAVAATGGVLLAIGLGAKSSVEDAPLRSSWAAVADDHDRAGPFMTIGGVLLAVGIADLAIGVTLLVMSGSSSERATTTVSLTPGGVRIAGSF